MSDNKDLSFLEEVQKKELTTEKLTQLSSLVSRLIVLKDETDQPSLVNFLVSQIKTLTSPASIHVLEEVVKIFKKEADNLSKILIPSFLNSCSLQELTLSSGAKIELKDEIQASVSKDKIMTVYMDMIEKEMLEKEISKEEAKANIDNYWKKEIVIKEATDAVYELLLGHDVVYDTEMSIHWQTLKSYCKNRLNEGKEIPTGITKFQYQETKLKAPKKTQAIF